MTAQKASGPSTAAKREAIEALVTGQPALMALLFEGSGASLTTSGHAQMGRNEEHVTLNGRPSFHQGGSGRLARVRGRPAPSETEGPGDGGSGDGGIPVDGGSGGVGIEGPLG